MKNKKEWSIFTKIFLNPIIKPSFTNSSIFDSKFWRTFTVLYIIWFLSLLILLPLHYFVNYEDFSFYKYDLSKSWNKIELSAIKNLKDHVEKQPNGKYELKYTWRDNCNALILDESDDSFRYDFINIWENSSRYYSNSCYGKIYNYFKEKWSVDYPNFINEDNFNKELDIYANDFDKYMDKIGNEYQRDMDYLNGKTEDIKPVEKRSSRILSNKIIRKYDYEDIFIYYVFPILILLFLKYWITTLYIILRKVFLFIKNW